MRFSSTSFAVATLLSVSSTFARPSPKVPGVRWPKQAGNSQHHRREVLNITSETASSSLTAPYENIFISLTNDEAAAVISFLHNQTELNLTASADAGEWDNAISVIDLVAPNKTLALDFLDGNGTAPERYAKAMIMFGAFEEPYLQDFIVGPLPISNRTTYSSLDYTTTSGSSQIRNYDADYSKDEEFKFSIVNPIADIILDLLNATYTLDEDSTLDLWGIDPLWRETDDEGQEQIVAWAGFWRYPDGNASIFDGETLLPQGLYVKWSKTGRDSSKWKLLGWLYNDQFYSTTADFRAAWENGIEKIPINYSGDWVGTDRVGDLFPEDDKSPPVTVQPDGQRFGVDVENKYVEWMDFSFYITFTRDTGMKLFDIKYKGDRIVYELGLQEAIAHYAGNDPVQSGTSYLDTFYGFGPYAFELISGFDCPTYSTFLDTTFHSAEVSKTHRNGICLFESDPGYLMQRHSSMAYVSATKNIVLTLRSVSTVGNYDYNTDYIFSLDGSIETVVRASGYIQSANAAQNGDYGYKIHDALSGSMHDHVLTWKVDIDVLGTNNSFAMHEIKAEEVKYSWSNTTRSTMKLHRSTLQSEDDSKLNWSANAQVSYIVENQDAKNKFNESRGFKVHPSRGGAGMHLTIQESDNLRESQSFATHQLYVTKQHDTEPSCAHANNAYAPADPIVKFSDFFDGESLVQEDLVLWINLGMHHTPHTGDLPNTVFTTAQSGFMISPHNYLLSDPSRASRQAVRINYNSSGVQEVERFGGMAADGTVDLAALNANLWDYSGDVAVRKFPYDPLSPYNDTESIV
ncbi:copper amine oxidase [Mrakia frigida]|uniref:copper amine oxidase n=1 Tax=Mrakia frigida TaxID=29902 RepID=UPI003FCC1F2B